MPCHVPAGLEQQMHRVRLLPYIRLSGGGCLAGSLELVFCSTDLCPGVVVTPTT